MLEEGKTFLFSNWVAYEAISILKSRVSYDAAKSQLPEGIIGPFVNDEFVDVFGIVVTLTGEGYSYAELKEVADEVWDELLLFKDVAKVDIYGRQAERIFVEYNNACLAELGISPYQMKHFLETRNIIIPGGDILTDKERIVFEPTGNFESIEDLRRTVIKLSDRKDVLFLEDLVHIYHGYINPPSMKMYSSGLPCLGIALNLRERGDILRIGFIVSAMVPMAMIMAILIMTFFHIGIDQMSLASLIIALGMLVDNGIFMAESIMVKTAAGKKTTQAAIGSAHELCIPMLTSSLALLRLSCRFSLLNQAAANILHPCLRWLP